MARNPAPYLQLALLLLLVVFSSTSTAAATEAAAISPTAADTKNGTSTEPAQAPTSSSSSEASPPSSSSSEASPPSSSSSEASAPSSSEASPPSSSSSSEASPPSSSSEASPPSSSSEASPPSSSSSSEASPPSSSSEASPPSSSSEASSPSPSSSPSSSSPASSPSSSLPESLSSAPSYGSAMPSSLSASPVVSSSSFPGGGEESSKGSTGGGGEEESSKGSMYSPSNGKGFYKGMPREFVNGQNKIRKAYGAEPLTWDKDLALYARRWANANRKSCKPMHSGSKYAENIYLGRNGWNATVQDAIYGWASEENMYNKKTGECLDDRNFSLCGHFAIMINKKYRWVGCGRAECFDGKGVFMTCNYNPTPPNATVPLATPPKN